METEDKEKFSREFGVAHQLFLDNKYDEALTDLMRLRETYGTSGAVTGLMGACYFNLDDYPNAEECFRLASEIRPEKELFSTGLWVVLWIQRKTTEALDVMNKYLSGRSPVDVPCFRDQIVACIGDTIFPDPRYNQLIAALKSMPEWADEIPRLQADAIEELKRDMGIEESGETDLSEPAVQREEVSTAETDELKVANQLLSANKAEEALAYVKRLCELYETDATLAFFMGACYFHLEDYARAEEYFRIASNSEPNNEIFVMGLCHALWNQPDKASEAIDVIRRRIIGRKPVDEPRFRSHILTCIKNTIFPGPRYNQLIEALKSMSAWADEIPRLQAEAIEELKRDMGMKNSDE